jgi:AcrR family transcriptional regulator
MSSTKFNKQNPDQSYTAKERIVQTATGLFESQGFAATGINQIIAESKTAKASFYDYFASKELLGKEYLRRYGTNHLSLIQALMDRSDSPHDFIRSWVRILKRQLKLKKFYGCPMSNLRAQTADSSPLLKREVKDLAGRTIDLLAEYLLESNPGGLFTERKAAVLAGRRVFSIYEGAIHVWQLTGDEAALDDIEFLVARILN